MQDTINAIMSKLSEFKAEADKAVKGNKSAGMRSRKSARELRNLLKAWAKVSQPATTEKA
ncbi:MAG: hypothetical protein AB7D37_11120 [Desulfovibrio sp.]